MAVCHTQMVHTGQRSKVQARNGRGKDAYPGRAMRNALLGRSGTVNALEMDLMIYSPSADPPVPSAAASTRLLETGVELVRAEIAVALSRARQAVMRAFTALLATILAAALLQVALVVCILAPLLVHTLPSDSVWMAVALPSVLALASLVAAVLAWSSLGRSLRKSTPGVAPGADSPDEPSAPLLVSLREESVRQ
jgi:hypothetical protein